MTFDTLSSCAFNVNLTMHCPFLCFKKKKGTRTMHAVVIFVRLRTMHVVVGLNFITLHLESGPARYTLIALKLDID